ncbi:SAM-dependent methyltransferase [Nocardia sp. NPDC059239]|uniref:SAM-dependent methyltransferase n=1 Tax=Nocardia sp. NPDC059239 TaxID=3346785 RepID=UPI00367F90E6
MNAHVWREDTQSARARLHGGPLVPHKSRIRNHLLGGKDNYDADRHFVDGLLAHFPGARSQAEALDTFQHQSLSELACNGIDQFLEIGTGYPRWGRDLHDMLSNRRAEVRVVYVADETIVHTLRLAMISDLTPHVGCVLSDPTEPATLIAEVQRAAVLDWDRPVAVTMVDVLEYLPEPGHAATLISQVMGALAPGSCLIAAHAGYDEYRRQLAEFIESHYQACMPYRLHTCDQFHELLGNLADPLLLTFPDDHADSNADYRAFGGIART